MCRYAHMDTRKSSLKNKIHAKSNTYDTDKKDLHFTVQALFVLGIERFVRWYYMEFYYEEIVMKKFVVISFDNDRIMHIT